jgi:hypothetical protein
MVCYLLAYGSLARPDYGRSTGDDGGKRGFDMLYKIRTLALALGIDCASGCGSGIFRDVKIGMEATAKDLSKFSVIELELLEVRPCQSVF